MFQKGTCLLDYLYCFPIDVFTPAQSFMELSLPFLVAKVKSRAALCESETASKPTLLKRLASHAHSPNRATTNMFVR